MPVHISEAEMLAAIEGIERHNRKREKVPGVGGVQARMQIAVLRPFYVALVSEINLGATTDELRTAVIGLTCNALLSIIDTISAREPAARFNEGRRAMVELGLTLADMMKRDEPGSEAKVMMQAGGHA